MESIKEKAHNLRKQGQYSEAIKLYEQLWQQSSDKYAGTGLLHCMRKLRMWGEAVKFAEELLEKFPDFNWLVKEIIWTFVQGKLHLSDGKRDFPEVMKYAEKIIELKPDDIALKVTVFKVIAAAKSINRWDIIEKWLKKVDPEKLDEQSSDKKQWSDRARWFYLNMLCKLKIKQYTEVLKDIDLIINRFPAHKKLFLRIKAIALKESEQNNDAIKIYETMCNRNDAEWWILYEYAQLIDKIGKKDDALNIMYKSISLNKRPKTMVNLLFHIGKLCYELKKYEEAQAHLLLCRHIRMKEKWHIPVELSHMIQKLNVSSEKINKDSNYVSLLSMCQKYWDKPNVTGLKSDSRRLKKDLSGKVMLKQDNQPFCFIETRKGKYFCLKKNLPVNIINMSEVIFDAIPSFDKKKNCESWKAVNIRVKN